MVNNIALMFLLISAFFAGIWFSNALEEAYAYQFGNYYQDYSYPFYTNDFDNFYFENYYNYLDAITPTYQEHYTPAWHYDSGWKDSYSFYDDYTNDFYSNQQVYVYDYYGWSYYP